ncbi:uncharacterized protein LOC131620225 [Vicia villosa]|uniref:uncharacterized protein LOC131620225 n=1 Tax=Vicia villosa TaxID=3911 RepID=UPI00273CF2E2|nr:uncharacterized protein LOC131620225 [Vicia villosa]
MNFIDILEANESFYSLPEVSKKRFDASFRPGNESHSIRKVIIKCSMALLKEDGIEEVVTRGWQHGDNSEVTSRIESCVNDLARWDRRIRKKHKEDTAGYLATMEAYHSCKNEESTTRFLEAQREYNKGVLHEEFFWKKHTKMHWLRCIKFFHCLNIVPKSLHKIDMLLDERGGEVRE